MFQFSVQDFDPKISSSKKMDNQCRKVPDIYSVKLYKNVTRCTSCNSPAWHVSTISEAAAENVSAVSTLVQERGPDYGLVRRSDVHFYVQHNRKTESYHKNKSQYKFVKLREREGQRVDLGGSLKGHLWMVDGGWWYTFPWCFTLNLVASPSHHHHHHPYFS